MPKLHANFELHIWETIKNNNEGLFIYVMLQLPAFELENLLEWEIAKQSTDYFPSQKMRMKTDFFELKNKFSISSWLSILHCFGFLKIKMFDMPWKVILLILSLIIWRVGNSPYLSPFCRAQKINHNICAEVWGKIYFLRLVYCTPGFSHWKVLIKIQMEC